MGWRECTALSVQIDYIMTVAKTNQHTNLPDSLTSVITQDEEIICHCSGTTVLQIKTLVKKRTGANSLKPISHLTGVCAGCGGCEPRVEALLAELNRPL